MRAPLVLVTLLAGCSLVSRFDPARTAEQTNALCSDGIDNDGDGLTDCQDFKCLPLPSCCNMPVLVLSDDFARRSCTSAACSAPDPTCVLDPNVWTTWGTPDPLLCGGGLSPNKSQLCYEVGALSHAVLPLHPGLSVTVGLAGIPETAGRLIVGLTLQDQIAPGTTECEPIEGINPAVSAIEGRTQNGYVLIAGFEQTTLGSSPEITDEGRHELKISVGADRRITWLLDGELFATSPASEALPVGAPGAHLGLAGRGLKSRFTDVKVSDGTQCDAPGAWSPADTFQVLAGANDGNQSWDSFQTYYPAVVRNGDQVFLYYAGCTAAPAADGCGLELAAGLATSTDGIHFTRSMNNPLEPGKPHPMLVPGVFHNDPGGATVNVLLSNNQLATQATQSMFTVQSTNQMVFTNELTPALNPGPPGTWDDQEICCGTAFQQGNTVLMWFAGHSLADPTWRIGIARSFDGAVSFVEDPHNPVLVEGGREDFDGRGVTDPEVVFDTQRRMFRLWYTAQGSLGRTSVAYAVSTDGVAWHKFPGNPVLLPSDVGLEAVGSPAVLADEGQLTMWLHGRDSSSTRLRIYNVINRGQPPQ